MLFRGLLDEGLEEVPCINISIESGTIDSRLADLRRSEAMVLDVVVDADPPLKCSHLAIVRHASHSSTNNIQGRGRIAELPKTLQNHISTQRETTEKYSSIRGGRGQKTKVVFQVSCETEVVRTRGFIWGPRASPKTNCMHLINTANPNEIVCH